MAADFSKPTTGSSYTTFPTEIRDMFVALALMLDTTVSNVPTNAIKWSATNKRFEKYNGTTWAALLDTTIDYAISVSHLGGSAAALYAKLASPIFTGIPAAPTAAADTNTTQLATTGFYCGQRGASTPLMDGTAAAGTSYRFSAQDHRHPTDTSLQPQDATLTALAGLTTAADKMIYATGADTFSTTTLTAFARTLMDDADAATARATLGITSYSNATETSAGVVELATSAEVQAGTDTVRAITPAGLATSVIGMSGTNGQTWQNLTGSRAIGTTYYNTTGRPISVVVVYTSANSATYTNLTVAGVLTEGGTAPGAGTYAYKLAAIVPPGASYVISGGSPTLIRWSELR